MERNIRLYPWFAVFRNTLFWMPVFFLFFRSHLTLEEVLRLEALYYFCVVLMEVPSGYFSDRVGRKATLMISSAAWFGANVAWFLGTDFLSLALGQVLLAVGMAFNSGTDTAFHLESLQGAGREEEYGEREARIARIQLGSNAAGAIIGGTVALLGLRWPYLLSAVTTFGAVVIAARFTEPPPSLERSRNVLDQLNGCLAQLKNPVLAWLFAFAVFAVVLNHIPYEFYQPYLEQLGDELGLGTAPAPLAAGLHMAASTVIAAWVAGRSFRIRNRLGLGRTLLLAPFIQTLVLAGMAFALHPLIVLLMLLRSTPNALSKAPLNAAVNPQVPQHLRASYLSVVSLSGRLAFSLTLAGFSLLAGGDESWAAAVRILTAATALGVVMVLVLALSSGALRRSSSSPAGA